MVRPMLWDRLFVMIGWMDQDAAWPLGVEVGLGPGDIVLDGDPTPHGKGHNSSTFRPISVVAKRSPISAAAELLYKCPTGWLHVSDRVLQNVVVAVQVQVAGIIGSRRRRVHHELRRRQRHRVGASSRSVTAADHDITAARQENYASVTVLTGEKTTTTTGASTTACRQQVHMGIGQ